MIIYVVEDDTDIRELESYALKNSGYDIVQFDSGKGVFESCLEKQPSMLLLDIMLPGENGMEILHRLKENASTKDIPVIMVTAKGSEYDKVLGLDSGADDYIAKPFGMMEMVSRIKAVLRRCSPKKKEHIYSNGCINMNIDAHIVSVNDNKIDLTYKEYEILKLFLSNQGIVFTRDQLLSEIWGVDYFGETRTVDMHIKTLRQKLGESGRTIKTVRNVGYRMETCI